MAVYGSLSPMLPEIGEGLAQDMAFRTFQYTSLAAEWRKDIGNVGYYEYPGEFIDITIKESIGDPATYSKEGIRKTIASIRSETRNFTYMLILGQVPQLTVQLIEWATTKISSTQAPQISPAVLDIINYLKEDTLYAFAHIPLYAQDSSPYSSLHSLIAPEMLNALAKRAFPAVGQDTVGVELGWLIACHSDTPTELLLRYQPESPQWYMVVAHKNFPVQYLQTMIDSLYNEAKTRHIDTKFLDAVFQHPSWNENTLSQLLFSSSEEKRAFLTPYVISHSECPTDVLEIHEEFLSIEAKARLARTTSSHDLLTKLAYHGSPQVREAVKENQYSTEEIRIIAALGDVI